jgi:DNA processing protein
MPGSVNSPLTKGCHSLIKDGAKLAESAEDILNELKLAVSAPSAAAPPDDETHAVLAHMGYDPCDFDTLAARSGVGADVLAALLTQWEIEGLVEALPGGRYQRLR